MTAQRQYTPEELAAYTQGLHRAEIICEERARGRQSANAIAIRRERMHTRMLAQHNHGITISEQCSAPARVWIAELLCAALILAAPFALFWMIFLLTGQPVRFG